MNMTAMENRGFSLLKALTIITQTAHISCPYTVAAHNVRMGTSLTYSGVASALFIFSALWSAIISCVTKRHFKRNDKLSERELKTKMMVKTSNMRGTMNDDLDVIWNDKFFTAVGQKTARKNSMFVNDTYVGMFNQ